MGICLLCFYFIASCTFKGDVSASAMRQTWRFISIDWYIDRPLCGSSCYFDGLSYISHFHLLRHVHSH